MTLTNQRLSYIFYFFVISMSTLFYAPIVPMAVKAYIVRALYILVLALFVISFNSILRLSFRTYYFSFVFFGYVFFSAISYVYHGGEHLTQVFSVGCSFFIFLLFFSRFNEWSMIQCLKPFFYSASIVLLLSLLAYFGFEINLYSDDPEILSKYDVLMGSAAHKVAAFPGVFFNQNSFGMLLMLFLMVSVSYVIVSFKDFGWLSKVFSLSLIMLSLFFLIKTMSRASILGFLLFLTIGFGPFLIKPRNIVYFVFASIGVLVFVFISQEYISLLYERTINRGTSSRAEIWVAAIAAFLDSFLVGVGHFEYRGYTAHNFFLDRLASSGLFSFLFLFVFILHFCFLSLLVISKPHSKEGVFEKRVFATMFLVIIFHQSFETHLGFPFNPLYLLFMLSLSKIGAPIVSPGASHVRSCLSMERSEQRVIVNL